MPLLRIAPAADDPYCSWGRCEVVHCYRNSGTPSLNPGLELGQAKAFSFIGIVIAPYRVRQASELLCLDVRKELDGQGALPIPIDPPLAWWLLQLFGRGAEQGPEFVLALSGELYRRLVRRGGSRRSSSGIGCLWRRFWDAGFGAFDGRCLRFGDRLRDRDLWGRRHGWRGKSTGKVVSNRAGLVLTPPSTQHRQTQRDTQDRSDCHFVFHCANALLCSLGLASGASNVLRMRFNNGAGRLALHLRKANCAQSRPMPGLHDVRAIHSQADLGRNLRG